MYELIFSLMEVYNVVFISSFCQRHYFKSNLFCPELNPKKNKTMKSLGTFLSIAPVSKYGFLPLSPLRAADMFHFYRCNKLLSKETDH